MNYSYPQIVLQEVPDEISLALSISGCPLRCKGCHSTETYNPEFGQELNLEEINKLLSKHKHITCVLFYGGEWEPENLVKYLKYIKTKNLKTCLYTGFELSFIHKNILNHLDYIKTGRYIKELGGLGSENTNQKFMKIQKGDNYDTNKM